MLCCSLPSLDFVALEAERLGEISDKNYLYTSHRTRDILKTNHAKSCSRRLHNDLHSKIFTHRFWNFIKKSIIHWILMKFPVLTKHYLRFSKNWKESKTLLLWENFFVIFNLIIFSYRWLESLPDQVTCGH